MFKGLQLSFHDKTVVVVDGQAQDYVTGDTIRVTESLNQRSSTVPANTYKDTVLVPRTDGFCIDLRGDYAKSMTVIVLFDEVGVEKKQRSVGHLRINSLGRILRSVCLKRKSTIPGSDQRHVPAWGQVAAKSSGKKKQRDAAGRKYLKNSKEQFKRVHH